MNVYSQSGNPTWLEYWSVAKRWHRCVDFASPMTAWTSEMHAEYSRKQQEKEDLARAEMMANKHMIDF